MRARDLIRAAQPITVRPDAPILEVQHLFVEAQIGGAPVVDAQGKVVGIISSADLLRVVDQVCDEDLDPSEPDEESNLVDKLATLTAADAATPEPIWVSPDATAAEVAHVMHEEGINRVLVGTDGRLVGILTAQDLLKAVSS